MKKDNNKPQEDSPNSEENNNSASEHSSNPSPGKEDSENENIEQNEDQQNENMPEIQENEENPESEPENQENEPENQENDENEPENQENASPEEDQVQMDAKFSHEPEKNNTDGEIQEKNISNLNVAIPEESNEEDDDSESEEESSSSEESDHGKPVKRRIPAMPKPILRGSSGKENAYHGVTNKQGTPPRGLNFMDRPKTAYRDEGCCMRPQTANRIF